MPSPNDSEIINRSVILDGKKISRTYYTRPRFVVYWFPFWRDWVPFTWTLRVAQDWDGEKQFWTETDCPYRKLTTKINNIRIDGRRAFPLIRAQFATVDQEDKICDFFLIDHPDDAKQEADNIWQEILHHCGDDYDL